MIIGDGLLVDAITNSALDDGATKAEAADWIVEYASTAHAAAAVMLISLLIVVTDLADNVRTMEAIRYTVYQPLVQ